MGRRGMLQREVEKGPRLKHTEFGNMLKPLIFIKSRHIFGRHFFDSRWIWWVSRVSARCQHGGK